MKFRQKLKTKLRRTRDLLRPRLSWGDLDPRDEGTSKLAR
jgi:hypothetical protein